MLHYIAKITRYLFFQMIATFNINIMFAFDNLYTFICMPMLPDEVMQIKRDMTSQFSLT